MFTFKNPKTESILGIGAESLRENYSTETIQLQQICNEILAEYAGEVLAISQEAGVDVDLTYGTIDEFKDTMKELWAERSDFESLGDNRKQLARTLAAYLILMAVNEHDCELHYSAPEDLEQSMASKLWGGSFRVMIGSGNNKVDLLPACIDAAYWDCKEMDHGVRVDPKEIDRLYRKATGESLSAHGFSEFNI